MATGTVHAREQIENTMQPLRLLGIFAHPDDETFCIGGTLAKYIAAGAEAMVVSFTRGEAGQIRDASVATRRTLGERRASELEQACRTLGVQQHTISHPFGHVSALDASGIAWVGIVHSDTSSTNCGN